MELCHQAVLETYGNGSCLGPAVSRPPVIFRLERGEVPWMPEGASPGNPCADGEVTAEAKESASKLGMSVEDSSREGRARDRLLGSSLKHASKPTPTMGRQKHTEEKPWRQVKVN
ncbi:zinc finger protein 69 homolog [Phascolarctos cinereus]